MRGLPHGVLTAAAIGSFVLLALHPGGTATDFAGILRQEAAGQTMDAIVHGGFIALLSVEMVCYLVLTLRLKRFGLRAWCSSRWVALLSGSLVTDGLVIPAIAAKYLPVPAKLETARGLFVLCESFIRVLMPMGLAFQAAAGDGRMGLALLGEAGWRGWWACAAWWRAWRCWRRSARRWQCIRWCRWQG